MIRLLVSPIIVTFSVIFMLVLRSTVEGRQVEMGGMDYALAVRDGAKARFTFRIVDEVGNVVTGAILKVSFGRHDSEWVRGASNDKGLFLVEGLSSGNMLYNIDKAGYYQTASEYRFGGEGKYMLEDGRWLPWNPTNTVILKSVKHPVPVYAVKGEFVIPLKGKNVGFDLEKSDWVEPYGKGEHQDLLVLYNETEIQDPQVYSKSLQLCFGTNHFDGVQKLKLDGFSKFLSVYDAPIEGYEKSVAWSFEAFKKRKDVIIEPSSDEYFVFRVRTVIDNKGKIVSANYGKIYGPIKYGLLGEKPLLVMKYYFNPEVNSRSLEFNMRKNLSGQAVSWP